MSEVTQVTSVLADLVAFPSVSGGPNGEIARYVGLRLAELGFRVVYDTHEDGVRMNVIASIGPECPGGIILSGHLDVVPAARDRWSGDPFTLRCDGVRLIGRGAVDMKGFLACCLTAAPDLAEGAGRLALPVHMVFTFDEEVGSVGAAQVGICLRDLDLSPGMAIVGEPTDMRPIGSHRGILELTTEVSGSPGHASDPRGRANAIDIASRVISHLGDRATALASKPAADAPAAPPWTTLSVGRIRGGEARNIIPQSCCFDWEIRPLPGHDGVEILRDVETWIAETLLPQVLAIDPQARIETKLSANCPGLPPNPKSQALRVISETWTREPPAAVSFATDAGYFHALGIDTVVFGPGSIARAHKPEEYITKDELAQGLEFLARLQTYLSA